MSAAALRLGPLRPDHFYREDHRRIFSAIFSLIDRRMPADVLTVFEVLESSGEAERCGGLAYLAEIADNTPSAANIRRYAEVVAERALLRQLMQTANEIAAQACQRLLSEGGDFGAVDANRARCRRVEARDKTHQRALPAARWSRHGNRLAAAD